MTRSDIYDTQFSIYHLQDSVGYLDFSAIFVDSFGAYVDISYAILGIYRRRGYMKEVLSCLSDFILEDRVHTIDFVSLIIDDTNIASSNLALKAGFNDIRVGEGYKVYSKKR